MQRKGKNAERKKGLAYLKVCDIMEKVFFLFDGEKSLFLLISCRTTAEENE